MNTSGVRTFLWKELRPAFFAALGGTIGAMWVPPLLMTMATATTVLPWVGMTEAPGTTNGMFGALFVGLIAFLVGAAYLVVVGFPVLFVLWVLRLRHPIFPALPAALVSLTSAGTRWSDVTLYGIVGVATGFIAGVYARRHGNAALERTPREL
jgi:hypothetical protein